MKCPGLNPWVTRLATETSAGTGVDRLIDALCVGMPRVRPAPWAWPGLLGIGIGAVDAEHGGCGGRDGAGDAEALLQRAVEAVAAGPGCGLIVGTTSGLISGTFEREGVGVRLHDYRQRPAQNLALLLAKRWGVPVPVATVSVACASGAAAFDLARGWLREGRCERVIVAGVDVLSPFIHAGFSGIGALAAGPSVPFRAERDGLMIGEGAAAVLLETPDSANRGGRQPLCALWGTGLSQDAVHLTAPDRTGGGLYRAAAAAVTDAGIPLSDVPDALDVVSGHATGTVFNDAMEAQALARLFGGAPVPVHGVKPVVGHTLGAAGTVEAVALIAMLTGAALPAAMDVDPALGMRTCRARLRSGVGWGLSVNAAFGGVNAALVFGPAERYTRPSGPSVDVTVGTAVEVGGESFAVADLPRLPDGSVAVNLGRADTYVRAGILALAELKPRSDEAVVLSSVDNCAQADRRYLAALQQAGPARAPRLHFVYTVPGAPLAEAAILLGVTGPGLVLCGDASESEAQARRLVAEGRVASAIALHVDAPIAGSRALARAVRYSVR